MSLPNNADKGQSSSGSLSSKKLDLLDTPDSKRPAPGRRPNEESRVTRVTQDRPRPQSRR